MFVRSSSVTHPPDDLTELGAIGHDDEVNRPAVGGPRRGRPGDGHQRSSGSNQDLPTSFAMSPPKTSNTRSTPPTSSRASVSQVHKLLRAEVERRLTAGSAPGTDDVRPSLTCELGCHRTDYAGRTVHKDALPRLKAAVLEQPLPRGQADITRAAPTVKSTSPGSGARLRASTATDSANVPSRIQSVRPNTRCPTDSPVVP